VTVPSVAVKVAEVVPADTVTLPGTESRLLELESETVVEPVGTATVRATVQVVVPPEFNEVESQETEDSCGVAKTGMVTVLRGKEFWAIYNSAFGSGVNARANCRYTR